MNRPEKRSNTFFVAGPACGGSLVADDAGLSVRHAGGLGVRLDRKTEPANQRAQRGQMPDSKHPRANLPVGHKKL